MKLTTIEIQNYRSLFGDAENRNHLCLELGDGMNTIVGPNNVGKSNIFRALAVALDPDAQFDRKKDMPAGWAWSKPSVVLTFAIPPKGRTASETTLLSYLDKYEKAVRPEGKVTYASKGIVKYRVVIEGGPESAGVRREMFMTAGAGARTLQDDDPLLKKALQQFGRCFHFVYIQSGQSLSSLLEGKFREILRSVLKEQLSKEYLAVEQARTAYVGGIRSGLLEPLTSRIAVELKDLFPEITGVQLNPEVDELERTLTNMGVSVTDNALTDLADKGTGVRGGVLIAILRHLADEGRRTMLCAVEEPEAFLHPGAQECLREDLEGLAERKNVSLLITTHSPFVVSRASSARVFSLAKEPNGRTVVAQSARGDEPHAPALGALFRDRLVVDVLDRARRLPPGATAILVVEGYTDEAYLRLADKLLGGVPGIDDIAIVQAGAGVGAGAGGASLAVMQALVARATSQLPVVALFDNDEAGDDAFATLKKINERTSDWRKGRNLLQYGVAIPKSDTAKFAWEAEDLWPDHLLERFVKEMGEDKVLSGKNARPTIFGGWQYSLKAAAKGDFVEFLARHATPDDAAAWSRLVAAIRKGADLS